MIDKLYFNKLDNAEFLQFMRSVIEVYNRAAHATLTPFLTPLSDALVDLSKAFGAERRNSLTDDIQELNKRRSDAIRGIKKLANSYTFHYDLTVRDAAALLLYSMNNYDRYIDKLSYQAKTLTINKLVGEWNADPQLSNALTLLHLQDWVQELSAVNAAFEQTYLDRVQDEVARKVVSFTKQREPVQDIYDNLCRFTVAYAKLNPATYEMLIEELNELIAKYKA